MTVDDRLCRAGGPTEPGRGGEPRTGGGQAGPGRPCKAQDGDADRGDPVAGVGLAVTGRPAAGGASIEGRPRANSRSGARSG